MSHLHVQPLFAGALARVTDVRCRAPAGACGPEERAAGHVLIFTRAGVFVRHEATTRGGRGRRVVVAEPVHALLMNRGEPYRVSHPAAGGDDCTSLTFDDAAALAVAGAVDARALDRPATPFRVTHAPLDAAALLRLRALRRALRHAASAVAGHPALAVEEESLALLAEVVRAGHRAHGVAARPARAATARARRDLVERTKETLAARPGAPRSLAALAREVHASPFHLTRLFREVVGVPVHQYLLRLRLAVALERVDGGERNLSALALDLGFSSHSHFTTAFRRLYGVVPSALGRVAPAPSSP
jgi:AraC family transcriptional regulator